ncbi:hypothetical protein N0V83_000423 [Neocucurbitaria cava]|uniref:Uncharacterized protein n=1 Tax=Neocucurbitaria cava TaxID=798079 RepID=A0A9W8YH33_9PLEO|nr:hypothetical protein N0V83_000423 [Neocucurbitaria cava]
MSSLTGQESSETQPDNPVNPGTTSDKGQNDPSIPFKIGDKSSSSPSGLSGITVDKSSYGQDNASGTSEQRSGEDLKSGGGSVLGSVEESVHARGEAETSRADARD